jgi:hypothetical protein
MSEAMRSYSAALILRISSVVLFAVSPPVQLLTTYI